MDRTIRSLYFQKVKEDYSPQFHFDTNFQKSKILFLRQNRIIRKSKKCILDTGNPLPLIISEDLFDKLYFPFIFDYPIRKIIIKKSYIKKIMKKEKDIIIYLHGVPHLYEDLIRLLIGTHIEGSMGVIPKEIKIGLINVRIGQFDEEPIMAFSFKGVKENIFGLFNFINKRDRKIIINTEYDSKPHWCLCSEINIPSDCQFCTLDKRELETP